MSAKTNKPELLKALEELIHDLWLSCEDTHEEFEERRSIIKARTAISAAKGEANEQ